MTIHIVIATLLFAVSATNAGIMLIHFPESISPLNAGVTVFAFGGGLINTALIARR